MELDEWTLIAELDHMIERIERRTISEKTCVRVMPESQKELHRTALRNMHAALHRLRSVRTAMAAKRPAGSRLNS